MIDSFTSSKPIEAPAQAPEPIIAFSHVGISFDGRSVLEDVSFSMNRGQTLCILGRSGVGKSVALRLLMGFLKPDTGSIHVEGQDISALGEEGLRAIRKRVTMVFQNGALFDSLSVRENVAFPLRERGGITEEEIQEKVSQLINVVGAEDVADALPASLSTGRKRAVAIARALAAEPEVVLYDEPTTMVDPIIARRLGDLIEILQAPNGQDQHCCHSRYALCRAPCRPGALSSSGPGLVFRPAPGLSRLSGQAYPAVSRPGRLYITFGVKCASYRNEAFTIFPCDPSLPCVMLSM